MGTDWVLTGQIGAATAFASLAIGALAAAALAVNNHRDIVHDAEVGRRTFAVVFGAAGSRHLFTVLLACPSGCCRRSRWPATHPPCCCRCCSRGGLGLTARLSSPARAAAFNAVLFAAFRLELWLPHCSRPAR